MKKGFLAVGAGLAALALLLWVKIAKAAPTPGEHPQFRVGDVISLGGDPANAQMRITGYTPGPAPLYGSYTVLVLTGWAAGQTLTLDCSPADLNYGKI